MSLIRRHREYPSSHVRLSGQTPSFQATVLQRLRVCETAMASSSRKDRRRRNEPATKSLPDRTRARRSTYDEPWAEQKPSPEPYRYTELEHTQSIRVLEVILVGDHGYYTPDILACKIRHCNLEDQPLYTAVSYTWGDEHSLLDLDVEGKVLRVRRNVYLMLRRLARPGQWRALWIDAICINQDNVQERNTQVRLMGTIYAKANFVLSWLDDNQSSMQFYSYQPKNTSALSMISAISRQDSTLIRHSKAEFQNMIETFFQHPYWQRR